MQRTMLVDAQEKRLVELRGELMRDVVFGWGIFRRLYAGGPLRPAKGGGARTLGRDAHRHQGQGTVLQDHQRAATRGVRSDLRQVSRSITLEQTAAMLKEEAARARWLPS